MTAAARSRVATGSLHSRHRPEHRPGTGDGAKEARVPTQSDKKHRSPNVPTKESVMSETSPTRRDVLATTGAAGALLLSQEMAEAAEGNDAIRPFRVNVPEEKLVDLRR